MEKTKIELLEREFILFESKIKELKRLKISLDSLDTNGFEKDVKLIEEKATNIINIPTVKRLIDNLKLKIEKKEVTSKSNLSPLIEQIFECNEKVNVWSPERLTKEYTSIYQKYNLLPVKEKAIIYDTIIKLYKKIQKR